jgi:hypothetical protein
MRTSCTPESRFDLGGACRTGRWIQVTTRSDVFRTYYYGLMNKSFEALGKVNSRVVVRIICAVYPNSTLSLSCVPHRPGDLTPGAGGRYFPIASGLA